MGSMMGPCPICGNERSFCPHTWAEIKDAEKRALQEDEERPKAKVDRDREDRDDLEEDDDLFLSDRAANLIKEISVIKFPQLQDPNAETRTDEESYRIARVLEVLKLPATWENTAQMGVYLQAFEIFLERNARHRAGWRVGGTHGLLVDIRKKVERLWSEFMLASTPPSDVDSAIDLINYAAFFVQAVDEEKRTGKPVGNWIWKE